MQKTPLGELNKNFRIKQITSILSNIFKASELEIECLHIIQNFLDKYDAGKVIQSCITVEYDRASNKYYVLEDSFIRNADWFDFIPFYVCYDCSQAVAFATVLMYMNAVRADVEDIRLGLEEMIKQSCRNEKKYYRTI